MIANVGSDVLVTTLLITMPPGDVGLPAHTHPGVAVGYVVEGEVLFQVIKFQEFFSFSSELRQQFCR